MRTLRKILPSLAVVVTFVLTGWTPALRAQSDDYRDPRDLEFVEVARDIHMAYRPVPLRYWVEGNVSVILNENDVVVVDGSGTNRSAEQVIAHIRSLTDKPVSVLINTHGHGDHTVGNSVYAETFPGIEIVARPETREYLTGSGIGYVKDIASSTESRKEAGRAEIQRLLDRKPDGYEAVVSNLREYYERDIDIRQEAYAEALIVPPTMTIDRRLVLHRPGRKIDIRYLGPGDTKGDVIVYLPDDRLVATGDMVVHQFPYGFSRHPLEWVETLDSLVALDFDILIPGHGEIQRGKTYLNEVRELLRYVQREVSARIVRGLDVDEVAESIDLSEFKDRFAGDDPVARYYFDEYFAIPNVRRTYSALVSE